MPSFETAPTPLPNARAAIVLVVTLLILLVLFGLFTLPRVFARFSSQRTWTQGLLLQYAPPRTRHPLARQPTTKEQRWAMHEKRTQWQLSLPSTEPNRVPVHVPSWHTLAYFVSGRLSWRIAGYSARQIIVLASYTVLIAVLMLLFCNPVKNANRAGWIALAQYPVAFALGSKTSLVGVLLGRGYEKLNFLHRYVGRAMFLATLFHVVGYLVAWTKAGTIEHKMTTMMATAGITALGAMSVLAIVSHPSIRNKFYTLFAYSHWVGFTTMIIATAYHIPAAIPWCLGSIALYVFDLMVRTLQSHYMSATLQFIPEMNCTRVSIPSLRSGWRAGQHVRFSVLSREMGLSVFESHPFTIASTSDDEEGLVLYCKNAGDWTGKLARLAKAGGSSKDIEAGFGAGRTVDVIVQGPYGGPGQAVLSSYSGAMLVCGGSGITFGLAAVQEMLRDAFDRSSRIRLVDLVWVVQDPTAILPFLATFDKILRQSDVISSISLRISIHYTRASSNTIDPSLPLHEGLKIVPGRPEISDALFASLGCISVLKNTTADGVHGMFLGVCGPTGLVESVRSADEKVGAAVRTAVGGLELVEESFGW